jgi:hypothetical protein
MHFFSYRELTRYIVTHRNSPARGAMKAVEYAWLSRRGNRVASPLVATVGPV